MILAAAVVGGVGGLGNNLSGSSDRFLGDFLGEVALLELGLPFFPAAKKKKEEIFQHFDHLD